MIRNVFLFCLLCIGFSLKAQGTADIQKIDLSALKKVPLIEEKSKNWNKVPVLFRLNDPQRKTDVACQVAVSIENIWFRVEVKDDIQYNDQIVGNIYMGDCLQLSIDARGDTTQGMPYDTRKVFGPDDNALGLAIAKGKPVGIVWTGELGQSFDPSDYSIVRNEKKKTTTYEVRLSWAKLKTTPFSYPTFGISMRVMDKDSETDQGTQLNFAQGVDGVPRTGLFENLTFENIPSQYTAISGHQSIRWTESEPVELFAGVSNVNCRTLQVEDAGKAVFALPVLSDKFAFYTIRYKPEQSKALADLKFTLAGSDNTPLSEKKLTMVSPEALLRDFINLLDSLITTSSNQLFTRHLKSVKSLTLTEWARALIYKDDNPKEAGDVVQYIQKMHEAFRGECGDWNSYLDGRRSLIMSFLSKRDQTLQYYVFTLPARWDKNATYPLYVELHGAGNPNPLSGISAYMAPSLSKLDLFGYSDVRSYAQKKGLGYHIAPFGRGNSGYTDIGEIDVWEAIADVESNYAINADRRYLYGFSMGGSGTFLNAIYRPDYWAAIAIYAGAVRQAPFIQNSVQHLAYLPKWIWCGEDDGLFDGFERMKEWLGNQPVKPVTQSTPGIGHSYLPEWQQKGVEWISQFTRKRPDEFTYYCFDNRHLSCWGITVTKDPLSNCIPVIRYKIEGEKVLITTENARAITIDTGNKGLLLNGKINVSWNGKSIFAGEAGEIIRAKD